MFSPAYLPSNHTTSTQSVRVNNITTHLYKSDTPSRETQVIIMRLRSQNTLQFTKQNQIHQKKQIHQTKPIKPTKPNPPYQTFQTESNEPNLPN